MEWVGAALAAVLVVAWIANSTRSRTPVGPAATPSTPLERRRSRRVDGRPDSYYYGWWGDMLRAHGYRCYYCGFHAQSRAVRLHKEHVIPLSRGGPHHISNIKPACQRCNLIKGTLTGEEFFDLIRSNGGKVPLTRSRKGAAPQRAITQRRLILQAVARLQCGAEERDSWSVEEIIQEVLAAGAPLNPNSLRANLSTMGTQGMLERVRRGRYRLPQ